MQMTVRLLGYFLNQEGRNANVLTETSGDTGPAAGKIANLLKLMNLKCLWRRYTPISP